MLRIRTVSMRLKCGRHPRYDPIDGEAAIKGNCPRCRRLLDIHAAHRALTALLADTPRRDTDPRPQLAEVDTKQQTLF